MAEKDFKIKSIEDIKPGAKPITGISAEYYSQPIYQYNEAGEVIGKRDFGGSGISKAQRKIETDPEKARVGDYYYDGNGNLNVVPNSPTDVFNKWKITSDTSLYEKPTLNMDAIGTLAAPAMSSGAVAGLAAISGAKGASAASMAANAALMSGEAAKAAGLAGVGIGAAGSAAVAGLPILAISLVTSANAQMAQERAYKKALEDWQKSQEKAAWSVAGDLDIDEDGKIYFNPDVSKAVTMNIPFSGSEVQKAFNKDTEVYFGDDGRLKVNVNPIFASTEKYAEMVKQIKQAYSGLKSNSDGANEAIEEIKDYINTANNQFKFREQSIYSYKLQIPEASNSTIEDAYTNEIGAYMSEEDGKNWGVKVYRNGKLVETTAKEVLESVYNMDPGKRSDYMLGLYEKMEDPNTSDEDKVYILSEIKLLQDADDNDQKYDNGQKDANGAEVKTINKYYGMLDQESIISSLNNWSLIGNVTVTDAINALDAVTPWNMHINDQRGLQEDPAAASAARIISAATSAVTSYMAMQGIEHGIIRPLAGKIGQAASSAMEKIAASGGKFSELVGNIQLSASAFGDTLVKAGNSFAKIFEGARLAAGPAVAALGYSMSELLYNATSDLVFDALKQGVNALAGKEPTADDFIEEFGTDLVMDLIMQYGPAGVSQMQTEMDNYRLDLAYAPYKDNVEASRQKLEKASVELDAVKNQMAGNRKNSKLYKEAAAQLKSKERAFKKADKEFKDVSAKAEAAVKEAMPSMSEELGAMLAGKIAKFDEKKLIMWARKKLTDENAALSTLALQAYNKTGDVYLFQALVNRFQDVNSVIRMEKENVLNDVYAKGTKKSFENFVNAVAKATPRGRFSKEQIQYMTAKAELQNHTQAAGGDAKKIKAAEEKYLPVINKIQGVEAERLDTVLETLAEFGKKLGESYVKSGAATKEEVKKIEDAALGINYIPLWKTKSELASFGSFSVPLTLKLGKDYDVTKPLFDAKDIQNPVVSMDDYAHRIFNNIARNTMAGTLKEAVSIEGLGAQLVGDGKAGAKPEYQDIIQESLDNIFKSKEQILKAEVSQDKYSAGLDKILSDENNNAAIKGIDELAAEQKKLQDLIKMNNASAKNVRMSKRYAKLIAQSQAKIKEQKAKVRADIDTRVRAAGEYFNKTYKKYGIKVDIDGYLTSAKYTKMIDGDLNSLDNNNLTTLKDNITKTINDIAPYLSMSKMNKKLVDKQVASIAAHTRNRVKKNHPEYTEKQQNAIVSQTIKNFRAQLSGDCGTMYQDDASVSTAGAYKINYVVDGKDASFYIKGELAREIATEMSTKNVADKRFFSETLKKLANIKRLLTTGIDPTRVLPNLLRDTIRNGVMSGGTDYWFFDNSPFGFKNMFTMKAKAVGDSDENIAKALNTLQSAQSIVSGSTYNESMHGSRTNATKRLVSASKEAGDNRGIRFIWQLAHDKKTLLETPMNWAEGLTRDRAASSAFMRAYFRGAGTLDVDTRLKNAYEASINAGRENTVNFSRRGTFIKQIASYVPYLSQRFSNIESTKIAFLKDPIGVSTRLFMFGSIYMMELSRTLADDRSRKNYYNLSEYDRENNIILSLGDGSLVTIPLDETLAALIYPWRRGLETLHNVDPEYFYKIMVNGFLELSPFDLSGFTEGDSFNLGRGVEKLGAQMLPTLAQFGYTQLTGRNMYYGSDVSVSSDSLAQYGNYNPTPGDYTTTGKNSKTLRAIADALGVEQWRLQQGIADLGGNVGQYVVNWLDRIAGAPEDAQGGKNFMDSTFKSFTGMDSTQVQYAFNDGLNKLEEEKDKLREKLINLNQQISLSSGTRMAELQEEYRKVKQDFAMKVGNFIDKYIGAYEIAGGLTKSQANRVWYLLNFSDDDSMAMSGSVESYYRDLAKKQSNNEATKLSANILDKYYDQTKNVYKDSSGKWHYYSPYGEQAFFNTVQGRGMEYQVGLRNLVEGDLSNLSSERSKAYDDREVAYQAKNWDEYDKIGLRFDEKVIETIAPYVKRYGAKNVLTNSSVLDYLEEWFFVPSSYMKSKYGKNVSLAHNASKQRAFVRPYIKELFGLSAGYSEGNYVPRPSNLVRGE